MKNLEILRELPKCERETQSEQMLLENGANRLAQSTVITNWFVKKKNCNNLWIAIKQSWRKPGVLYLSIQTGHVESSGIDQGSNMCPLHWQMDFQPQDREVLLFKYMPGFTLSNWELKIFPYLHTYFWQNCILTWCIWVLESLFLTPYCTFKCTFLQCISKVGKQD